MPDIFDELRKIKFADGIEPDEEIRKEAEKIILDQHLKNITKKYNDDRYTWQAVYNDGTSIWECHKDLKTKQGHLIIGKYDEIDRDRLEKFNVYEREKLGTKNLEPIISVDIKSGYRLIWRKRRHQRVIGTQVPFKTVYLVGWQATVGGKNVQSIIYLYEDGKMEMSSQKNDYELFNFEIETP